MLTSLMFSPKDSIIFISIFLGFLFALFFLRQRQGIKYTNRMLAVFLGLQSLVLLISVFAFSPKFADAQGLPNSDIFYVLSILSYIETIFLFFYTRSLGNASLKIVRSDAVYLIPLLGAVVYTYFVYYSWDAESRQSTMRVELCSYLFVVHIFITLGRLIFAVFCLKHITDYKHKLKERYSNSERIDFRWLYVLILSYILTRSLGLIAPFYTIVSITFGSDELMPGPYFDILHFFIDLTWLLSLSTLIYFGMHYSPKFQGLSNFSASGVREIKEEHVQRLESYVKNKRPYISPDLTIDELSTKLSIPVKLLSTIINKKYDKNFCEYINEHRILFVKDLLVSVEHKDKTISHVMELAGFNSKATFNRVFKQFSGTTPVAYRRQKQI